MQNPKYLVNIYYTPSHMNGQALLLIGGITQSVPTYSDPFFVASMPEVKLYATGSSYESALASLLITASASAEPSNPPLNTIRTW